MVIIPKVHPLFSGPWSSNYHTYKKASKDDDNKEKYNEIYTLSNRSISNTYEEACVLMSDITENEEDKNHNDIFWLPPLVSSTVCFIENVSFLIFKDFYNSTKFRYIELEICGFQYRCMLVCFVLLNIFLDILPILSLVFLCPRGQLILIKNWCYFSHYIIVIICYGYFL